MFMSCLNTVGFSMGSNYPSTTVIVLQHLYIWVHLSFVFLQHPVESMSYMSTNRVVAMGLSLDHNVSFPSGLGMRLDHSPQRTTIILNNSIYISGWLFMFKWNYSNCLHGSDWSISKFKTIFSQHEMHVR